MVDDASFESGGRLGRRRLGVGLGGPYEVFREFLGGFWRRGGGGLVLPGVLWDTIGAVALDLYGVVTLEDLGISLVSPVFTPRVSHNPVRNVFRGDSPSNYRDGMIGSSSIIRHENSSSCEIHKRSSVNSTSDWSSSVDLVHHVLDRRHVDFSVLFYSVGIEGLWPEARSGTKALFADSLGVAN